MLHGFSFALVVGIIIGTYSSVFIASPIWSSGGIGLRSRRRAERPRRRPLRLADGRPAKTVEVKLLS